MVYFMQEGGLFNHFVKQEMDKVARRAGNEDHAKGVPLQLTNYQAPIGMFIIFNVSAVIVFCIELFKENFITYK